MTDSTTQTELTAVQAAILAITTGNYSSLSSNGKALTRLPLTTLYDREEKLLARLASESGLRRGGVIRINRPV